MFQNRSVIKYRDLIMKMQRSQTILSKSEPYVLLGISTCQSTDIISYPLELLKARALSLAYRCRVAELVENKSTTSTPVIAEPTCFIDRFYISSTAKDGSGAERHLLDCHLNFVQGLKLEGRLRLDLGRSHSVLGIDFLGGGSASQI